MSLQVDQLLDSLRKNGTIDSEGTFTLSLSKARAKMAEFQSSDPARYLVSILSAGVGGGARKIWMIERGVNVEVRMEGAKFSEATLLQAFGAAYAGEEEGALDLVLGCRGALSYGADRLELSVVSRTGEGYRWVLLEGEETSEVLPPGESDEIVLRIFFQESVREKLGRFFQKLGGFVGRRPELRLVDQLADHSPVPIFLNGKDVRRPFFLASSPLELQIGHPAPVQFSSVPLNLPPRHGWSAGLAWTKGRIAVVVRGVVRGTVESEDFSGIVFHDTLPLDLTREKLRHGEATHRFLAQLEEMRNQAVLNLSSRLSEAEQQPWYFQELFDAVVQPGVAEEHRRHLAAWLGRMTGTAANGSDLYTLVKLGLAWSERTADFCVAEEVFLRECASEFTDPGVPDRWIPLTVRFYTDTRPTQTLVRGYLLLGLGARAELQGESDDARSYWMESLDTVRAGSDDRAEELIHAHMDFSPEHMLKETAKALRLQVSRLCE